MAVKQMRAKYHGRCANCEDPIPPGASILYSTEDRKAYHASCPQYKLPSARVDTQTFKGRKPPKC